jgi:uncharacterized protein
MTTEYDKRAAELAKLPRAERFEKLIEFPTKHTFKVIGKSAGFSKALEDLLEDRGFDKTLLVERPSKGGRFISLTFTLPVQDGEELDKLYDGLANLPGIAYLL